MQAGNDQKNSSNGGDKDPNSKRRRVAAREKRRSRSTSSRSDHEDDGREALPIVTTGLAECDSSATLVGTLFDDDDATFPAKKVVARGNPFSDDRDCDVVDEEESVRSPDFVADGDNAAAVTARHVHFFSKVRGGRWRKVQSVQVRYECRMQSSVAIFENTVVVGVPNDYGTDAGEIWVFEKKDGGSWEETAKYAQAEDSGGNFGASVDIHSNMMVVGAPSYHARKMGRVHVFWRMGENNKWVRHSQLSFKKLGCKRFGAVVAMRMFTIAVTDGSFTCNSLYVFEYKDSTKTYERVQGNLLNLQRVRSKPPTFMRYYPSGSLAMTEKGNIFIGTNYSISDTNEFSGALFFQKQDGKYILKQVFSVEGRDVKAIAVDGWCNMAMVTVPQDDDDSDEPTETNGRVLVYKLRNDKWEAIAEAHNPQTGIDYFGRSISMSRQEVIVSSSKTAFQFTFELLATETNSIMNFDGALLRTHLTREPMLAIDGDNAAAWSSKGGMLYFFRNDEGKWLEIKSVQVKEAPGYAVNNLAISGNTVVLGVPEEYNPGSAYVFERDASSGDWNETKVLTPPKGDGGSCFGQEVAIDGNTIAVSAPNSYRDGGKVHVFWRTDVTWEAHSIISRDADFGKSVKVKGRIIVASDRNVLSVFEYDSESNSYKLSQENLLDSCHVGTSYGSNGRQVSMTSDGGILVGKDGSNPRPAVLYFCKSCDGKYVLQQEIPRNDFPCKFDGHESNISSDGNLMVIGSRWLDGATAHCAYLIYRRSDDGFWEKIHELRSETTYKQMVGGSNAFVYERNGDGWRKMLEINNHYGSYPALRSTLALSRKSLIISSIGQSANLYSFTIKD
ncbi:hypothetical protein ACHAWF_009271 [Thalassiosira exigua]